MQVKLPKPMVSQEIRFTFGLNTQALKQYIEQNPDAYLYERAEMFSCSTSTIFYALKKLGITRKKRPPLTKNKTQKK